jgi:hypothetical protein
VTTGATTLHKSAQGGHPFIHPDCLDGNQTHAHKAQRPGPTHLVRHVVSFFPQPDRKLCSKSLSHVVWSLTSLIQKNLWIQVARPIIRYILFRTGSHFLPSRAMTWSASCQRGSMKQTPNISMNCYKNFHFLNSFFWLSIISFIIFCTFHCVLST